MEMHRSYHAYSVPDMKSPPNPAAAYADPATPESLVKNSITVALAIISDVIIVYRTYVVWDFRYSIVLVPTGLLFGDVGKCAPRGAADLEYRVLVISYSSWLRYAHSQPWASGLHGRSHRPRATS